MLVSVYIRKDDEEKWKALENKTEVISNLLNDNTNTISNTVSIPTETIVEKANTVSTNTNDNTTSTEEDDPYGKYFNKNLTEPVNYEDEPGLEDPIDLDDVVL